jgi:hypothetical protein
MNAGHEHVSIHIPVKALFPEWPIRAPRDGPSGLPVSRGRGLLLQLQIRDHGAKEPGCFAAGHGAMVKGERERQ